jgi:hypothetical protein
MVVPRTVRDREAVGARVASAPRFTVRGIAL